MKLETIHLENWKKFAEPREIQLQDGLNILHGANESGKTTFMDSLITTFYSKHTSSSARIKSLKPWGTSLQPRSTITFTKNREKYRISKGFQEKRSILEKMDGNNWKKIAEGDRADKELIQLVGGALPGRGDTRPEQWGLGQTLWMVQGKPIISDDLNDETLSSLQAMVGATIESDTEKIVLSSIRSRFLEIYTEKTRTLKKGSQLKKVQDEINNLQGELSQSLLQNTKRDELIRQIEDTEFLLNRNQANLQAATGERDKLAGEVEAAQEHQNNREELEREIKEINTEFETLNQKIGDIVDSYLEIDQVTKEKDEMEVLLNPLETELDNLKEMIQVKKNSLSEITQKMDQANGEKSIVGIAHTTVMDEQALESLKQRFQEIDDLYQNLYRTQEELSTIIAPTTNQMEKIEKLQKDIEKTQISLEAMGLVLNISPEVEMSGDITLDSEITPFFLEKDESFSWTANQSLKIKIDHLGELEVKSGSEDVRVMKAELEKMELLYQELVAPFGSEDIDELKSLIIRKKTKKDDIKRIESELSKKTDKNREELQKEIIEYENTIKLKWSKIPDDSPYSECESRDKAQVREDLSRKIIQLEGELKTLGQERDQLNNDMDANRTLVQELEKNIHQYKTDIHGKAQILDQIKKGLKRLESDGISQEERQQQLNQLSVTLDQKKRAWQVYQDEIDEKEKQPLGAYEGLKTKVQRLEEDIQNQKIKMARWDSELQILINQSRDTNLLEEKLEQLKSRERELDTEAQALELLFDLTSFYRENTISELSEPIRQQVTGDLEKLLGPKYSLSFSREMKPDSIEVCGEEAPLDLLSFGTQEQVWCLFRLALGNILSGDEQQLVVLDDPLVNTDPVRMHHALEILEENARNMQIIVVTCDVDKYNSLKDANFISVE
ncbi:hypothetical protein BK009_03765 [Methanobacterium subterraneum]|uniref:Endonuclease GajA/Old nuclease/RecF-like AAA domain-containing protein n=1 Tax=Methanobacterium subterraneum TaxID=59277 RepID=A0A2H4VP57_9EURY|nr:AAA family ATPase [Methanobacterium subterraneum]AUB59867.1 hypothetical protein BK009_03765 [Methanobacterium subterraneum]